MAATVFEQNQLRVIGALLSDNPSAVYVVSNAKAEWFGTPAYRSAYRTLAAMVRDGEGVTLVSARRALQAELKNVSVDLLIRDAESLFATRSSLPFYVRDLRFDYEQSKCAEMGRMIRQVAADAKDTESLRESVSSLVMDVFTDADDSLTQDVVAVEEAWTAAYTDSSIRRIPFAWPSWNKYGGFTAGEIVVYGGYTGHGKTWIGLQSLIAAAESGASVLYASLEMTTNQITNRLLSMLGNVSLDGLEGRTEPLESLKEAWTKLKQFPVFFSERVRTIEDLKSAVLSKKVSGQPVDVVVVDHLHLMRVVGRDYRLGLDRLLAELKTFAVRERVAIVLLAQLNRPSKESRVPPPPTLGSLKESSGIEQIADYVVFVNREVSEGGVLTDNADAWLAKKRTGRGLPPLMLSLSHRGLVESFVKVTKRDSYV